MRRILLFMMMIFMEGCKLGELEPPKPILTVHDKEMDYKIATYSWAENGHAIDADAAAPPYLVENMDFNVVPADAKLLIRFRYQPVNIEAGIWKNDRVHFERVMNNTVILPKDQDLLFTLFMLVGKREMRFMQFR
jgi:hypothetical protein